jgi:polyhydroxyalkanoate synthesis regulator phasin
MNGWEAIATSVLGAGGLAAIVATLTKYWLERNRQNTGLVDRTVNRAYMRIEHLEKMHAECLRENHEMQKRVGFLEAKVETMMKLEERVQAMAKTIDVLNAQLKKLTDKSKRDKDT